MKPLGPTAGVASSKVSPGVITALTYIICAFVGFMLTSAVMVQFTYFIYLMKPGRIQRTQLLIMPLSYGAIIGTGFGLYEIAAKPQRRN
jgi:hypothetical protein